MAIPSQLPMISVSGDHCYGGWDLIMDGGEGAASSLRIHRGCGEGRISLTFNFSLIFKNKMEFKHYRIEFSSQMFTTDNLLLVLGYHVNILRPRQNDHHFAENISELIFLYENFWTFIQISLQFVCICGIKITAALVQMMTDTEQALLSEPIWPC